jgi:hypothetical protein
LAWHSACFMISSVMPAILMSICSEVMPSLGAGHLEVHVAEMILVAEDVGEHREALAFEDEAHGDAGARDGFSGTPASISASEVPQTVAIEDEPFDSVISETTRIV